MENTLLAKVVKPLCIFKPWQAMSSSSSSSYTCMYSCVRCHIYTVLSKKEIPFFRIMHGVNVFIHTWVTDSCLRSQLHLFDRSSKTICWLPFSIFLQCILDTHTSKLIFRIENVCKHIVFVLYWDSIIFKKWDILWL